MTLGKIVCLLIEDADDDWTVCERAFKQLNLNPSFYRCCDTEETIDYLQHRGKYNDITLAPKPDLILLNLNLSDGTGRELLKTIRSIDEFKEIPLIVLSPSANSEDIKFSYANGANSYMTKPIDYHVFIEKIQNISHYGHSSGVLLSQKNNSQNNNVLGGQDD